MSVQCMSEILRPRWGESLGGVNGPVSDALVGLLVKLSASVGTDPGQVPIHACRAAAGDNAIFYTVNNRVIWALPKARHWNHGAGFREATRSEQNCFPCQHLTLRYLQNRAWKNREDPRALCPECMRTPIEYLLAHVPEHAKWFERATALATSQVTK